MTTLLTFYFYKLSRPNHACKVVLRFENGSEFIRAFEKLYGTPTTLIAFAEHFSPVRVKSCELGMLSIGLRATMQSMGTPFRTIFWFKNCNTDVSILNCTQLKKLCAVNLCSWFLLFANSTSVSGKDCVCLARYVLCLQILAMLLSNSEFHPF